MLSLDLARKLKEAKLSWTPRRGDLFLDRKYIAIYLSPVETPIKESYVWLPRLGQLLAEIERRGYNCELACGLSSSHRYIIHLFKGDYVLKRKYGDALDDVVAEALLWILEREKEGNKSDQP